MSSDRSPLAWFGQRSLAAVPAGQLLALHLVRPVVVRRRTVVLAHDTIPVRWARPWPRRLAQRMFYAASARTARVVLAYSAATAANLTATASTRLARAPRRPHCRSRPRRASARAAGDDRTRARPASLRRPRRAHKNLDRAVAAFAASGLAHGGAGRSTSSGRPTTRSAISGGERRARWASWCTVAAPTMNWWRTARRRPR